MRGISQSAREREARRSPRRVSGDFARRLACLGESEAAEREREKCKREGGFRLFRTLAVLSAIEDKLLVRKVVNSPWCLTTMVIQKEKYAVGTESFTRGVPVILSGEALGWPR